ncbi:HNH endonuclease [Ruegeria lacuscaerulensis]|uniref:HNH endonuclease n=1 Tax=Ruegeria lacuscaerulensis TaxID=55218 RepID=UPI001481AAFA|nr:hypothetical protein [Ruegeria lacuscaerulensis]
MSRRRRKTRGKRPPQLLDYRKRGIPKRTRKRAYALSNKLCEICGKAGHALHHLTYERKGNEIPADLVMLCKACHTREHWPHGQNNSDFRWPHELGARHNILPLDLVPLVIKADVHIFDEPMEGRIEMSVRGQICAITDGYLDVPKDLADAILDEGRPAAARDFAVAWAVTFAHIGFTKCTQCHEVNLTEGTHCQYCRVQNLLKSQEDHPPC